MTQQAEGSMHPDHPRYGEWVRSRSLTYFAEEFRNLADQIEEARDHGETYERIWQLRRVLQALGGDRETAGLVEFLCSSYAAHGFVGGATLRNAAQQCAKGLCHGCGRSS